MLKKELFQSVIAMDKFKLNLLVLIAGDVVITESVIQLLEDAHVIMDGKDQIVVQQNKKKQLFKIVAIK